MEFSCSEFEVQPQLEAVTFTTRVKFSCSEFEVQPQLVLHLSAAEPSLAVQNSRSSRNSPDLAFIAGKSLAVQNSRSSRNAPIAVSMKGGSLAVQNSRSSRNPVARRRRIRAV